MDPIDYHICDYILYNFKNMPLDLIPRSYELEKEFLLMGKLDYLLFKRWISGPNPNVKRGINWRFSGAQCLKDLLDIEERIWREIPLKYFGNYCDSKKLSLGEGMKSLEEEFQSELASKDFLTGFPPEELVRRRGWQSKCLSYYDGKNNCFVYKAVHQEKKLFLPLVGGWHRFVLAINPRGLCGFQELQVKKDASVILTDSFELAHRNNYELNAFVDDDFVWCSWYNSGPELKDDLVEIDFEALKGRRVYYLVKPHSGFGIDEAIERAQAVVEHLTGKGNLQVKYLVYFTDEVSYYNNSPSRPVEPRVFNKKDFADFLRDRSGKLIPMVRLPRRRFQEEKGGQRQLLAPLLYERTCTVISGSQNVGKTWFAMSLAVSLVKKSQLIDSWDSRLAADVLFVHGKLGWQGMVERLELLFNVIGKKKSKLNQPTSFLEMASPSENVNALDSEIDWLYKVVTAKLRPQEDRQRPQVLILDSLISLLDLADPKAPCVQFNNFVDFLKFYNIALILLPPSELTGLNTLKKRVKIDSEITIRKGRSNDARKLGMEIQIKKGFKLPKATPQQFKVGFVPDSVDGGWTLIDEKREIFDELKLIYRYLRQDPKMSGRELAIKLNIKESLVKKRKSQLLSEEPIRDPLQKKRFMLYRSPEGFLERSFLEE